MLGFGSSTASASTHTPGAAAHGHVATSTATPDAGVLYSQNDSDQGIGIVSQNFEAALDAYDSTGADDFTVPALSTWVIKEVDVTGVYFNGPGPAVSETVTIYKNAIGGTHPGKALKTVTVTGTDTGGSFAIRTGNIKLKAGTYWIGVQVNLDFTPGGEWGWETRTAAAGAASTWQNPGNGFATGCKHWGATTTCIPSGEGPDYMFALVGVAA